MITTRRLIELGFFHEATNESSYYDYTSKPTSDFDVLRFLDEKEDFYCLPKQVRELKKKNIIITDPTIALNKKYGTSFANTILQDKLYFWSELIEQGFTVYVWTNEGLCQVTNHKDLFSTLENVDAINHKDLIKLLAEQGMASKDCYLAGISQTIKILTKSNYKKTLNAISIDDLMKLSEMDLQQFLDHISDSLTITINAEQ
jgi:hypothetical protein